MVSWACVTKGRAQAPDQPPQAPFQPLHTSLAFLTCKTPAKRGWE